MTKTTTDTRDLAAGDSGRTADYRRQGWWTGERLVDRFERFVTADPTRMALIDDRGITLTRRDLWAEAGVLADALADAAVEPGDVVIIYAPNTSDWQVSFLATLRLGAVPATIPITTDAPTLAHVYRLIGARAIVTADTHRGRPTGQWARDAAIATGRLGTVVTHTEPGVRRFAHVDGDRFARVVPANVDHLMFTSSTTGLPKAVMHTSDTLGAVNIAFAARFGIDETTPIFMPSPLGHSVGAWHGARLSLFTGATLVLQSTWDPVRALQIVDEQQCAFTAAATPFLKDIVDAPWPAGKTKLSSLKTFLCGGAPVPPSLMQAAARQAPNTFVTVLWGMTEGAGTTCTPRSTREQLTRTAGRPLPNLELAIHQPDESGQGELLMRGAGVFIGYLGQEDMYRSLLTGDGWFHTGDLARIDTDGYLHLTGRLKDIIIRGGVNISPVAIEDAIAAHPAVRRVAVIGQPDERLGERICAVIVPAGTAPSLDELTAWLRERGLPERKLPEALEVVHDMPVTAAGKIRKADLRRMIIEGAS